MAKGTELATAYVSILADTSSIDKDVRKALDGTAKHGDKVGKDMGARMSTALSSSLGKSGTSAAAQFHQGLIAGIRSGSSSVAGEFGKLGQLAEGAFSGITSKSGVAALAIGGIGIATVAAGKQLYDLGAQWDDIADGITGKTGLVGKELDKITDSVKAVGKDSSASLADIGDATGSLVQSLKLTGKPLQDLTRSITDLNELTGDKLNVRDLAKVFKGFNVPAEDMDEALDRLYDTFTNTGIPVSELIQTLKSVGPTARTLGLDIGQISGILATLEEAGVDGATALKGLKIGIGNLAKKEPGKDPLQAIQDVVAQIQSLIDKGNETAAIDLAKSTFGKSWQPIFDTIANGKLTVDDLNTSVENTGRTIERSKDATDDWKEEFQKLKNTWQTELEPTAASIFGGINDFLRETITLMDAIAEHRWKDAWNALFPGRNTGPLPTPGVGQQPGAQNQRLGRGGAGNYPNPQPGVGQSPSTPNMQHPGPPQAGGGGNAMPRIPGSYGLPPGANSGGYGGGGAQFPDWVNQIADAFGIKPSTYSGHQTSNRNEAGYAPNPQGLNRGIDWSGPVQNMQKFADYLATVPGGLEQVIWQNPGTGATVEIAGGIPQPGYFSGDLGGHQNHVHTRQSTPIPLPSWWRMGTFDQGGWLPPGATMAVNATGKPEMILTPEQLQALADQGIDPNTLLHGQGQGAAPGPGQQLIDALAAPGMGSDVGSRTEGYIPAAAGSTGVAGTSFAASLLNLGNEAVAAAIDQAAGAGAMAANAFAPGAGAGVQLGADLAKRGVSYGFQMASIGVDALVEQLTPFGAPRWLGYDYTGFMPQLGQIPALTTSLEKAVGEQGQGEGKAPPMPPGTEHMLPGAQPGVPVPPGPPPALPSSPGALPSPGAGVGPGAGTPPFGQPPTPSGNMSDPNYLKDLFGFDQGGWMQPGSYGVNLTNRPEPVFTNAQWSSIEKTALTAPDGAGQFGVRIENLYATDADDVKRKIDSQQRLAMMRYSGRP